MNLEVTRNRFYTWKEARNKSIMELWKGLDDRPVDKQSLPLTSSHLIKPMASRWWDEETCCIPLLKFLSSKTIPEIQVNKTTKAWYNTSMTSIHTFEDHTSRSIHPENQDLEESHSHFLNRKMFLEVKWTKLEQFILYIKPKAVVSFPMSSVAHTKEINFSSLLAKVP